MQKIYNEINKHLVDMFNIILSLEEKWLKTQNINLTINEIHIIEKIGMMEFTKHTEIAKSLNVTPGTLTVATNRLVLKKYIKKVVNEKDKRIVNFSLTKSGEKVFLVHKKFHDKMVCSALEGLKEVEILNLEKIVGNLNTFFKTVV